MDILAKNLLILASAGSGKTFQLGNRVIGLVARGVAPERIVALTFTRKAAGEFADSVLTKLADAAASEATAAELRKDLALPDADFGEALERVVRVLPRIMLGTMDSFFAKVIRGFQYEMGLTGGRFDLLEGARAAAARDELLSSLLGAAPAQRGGDNEFLHAFRRAMLGKEDLKVLDELREFVAEWQGHYRAARNLAWGPDLLAGAALGDWEDRKQDLLATVWQGLDAIQTTDKRQRAALEKALEALAAHAIGSGSLGGANGLLESMLAAVAAGGTGALGVKFYKDFEIGGAAGGALREAMELAAQCEMAAALQRTRAVREVVAGFDALCEQRLRRRGMLGFDDVKFLMGEWVNTEEARLRREAVDFRLDARYDHWLLDEFQDTSRADWLGLVPLMDEAAAAGEGSMFIVGDRKQAIYAWRGGQVGLFDEVMRRYQGGLEIEPMAESWRSCPQVLELVNKVCDNPELLQKLFGEAADRWRWQKHEAAAKLQTPANCGEARVEVVAGKWAERLERLAELLAELGIGRRALSCGVLVRNNKQVREVADHLRAAGFDVIEEGRREPAKDNPVGIVLGHLLKWLADPADAFAREVIEMSPLAAVLSERFGEPWHAVWEGLSGRAASVGFAGMLEEVVDACWAGWSDFGRRRAGDLLAALAALDAQGGASVREAADRVERLEVSQSPGVAAVQVMTIHKAKGLGFEVVVVPDVPAEGIPQTQRFGVAQGDGWISQTPPKWARDILPLMRDAEARWAADQRYEAFCTLYVALTRAKRGLYVLLEPPSKSRDEDRASLSNWLEQALGSSGEPGVVYQSGAADWIDEVPPTAKKDDAAPPPPLGAGVMRRERSTPSSAQHQAAGTPLRQAASGMRFGSAVHAAFERVGWIDETPPGLPDDDAGRLVAGLLREAGLRGTFERSERNVELFCEQPIDALIDGRWLSGVIDRLHVHRDAAGAVTRVEVIDFKTDALGSLDELVARHGAQMQAYREVMERAFSGAKVECVLFSTYLKSLVSLAMAKARPLQGIGVENFLEKPASGRSPARPQIGCGNAGSGLHTW
ncbi:MAG: ATP-dependent exoDNAse (exonuclease V) beta subunit (contains helicase and exonuclease domains) [Verrucomicrobia bacterium]|nr:MAG: ATP-dependent exoDNAse (exonuclease V) beta subunit (contains helicase and exonuclease domains) [Verrucomicrobiota bacterium]